MSDERGIVPQDNTPAVSPEIDESVSQAVEPAGDRLPVEQGQGWSLYDEWEASGGYEKNLERVQNAASTILAGLPDAHAVAADFDALPDAAQSAIFVEIALPPEVNVRPATDKQLETFRDGSEVGRVLIEAWGRKAPVKLAAVQRRITRVLTGMPPDSAAAVADWLDSLPPQAALNVLWELAGDTRQF